jgi:hypothetical protein
VKVTIGVLFRDKPKALLKKALRYKPSPERHVQNHLGGRRAMTGLKNGLGTQYASGLIGWDVGLR